MPCVGEMEGEHGRCALGMAQGTLDEPGRHASCKPMGGGGMPQGMDGDAHAGDAGPLFGGTAGALDARATPRSDRRRTGGVGSRPVVGKSQGGTMALPGRAAQREGRGGQGDGPTFGALPTMARELETLAIAVGDLRGEGCLEPESQARDRGEGDWVVARGGRTSGGARPPQHSTQRGDAVHWARACVGGWASRAGGRVESRSGGHWSRYAWRRGQDHRGFCGAGRSAAVPVQSCRRGLCRSPVRGDGLHGQTVPACVRLCR